MRLKCRRGSHSLSAASQGAAKSQAELATAVQASIVLAEDVTRTTSCSEGIRGPYGGATTSLEGVAAQCVGCFLTNPLEILLCSSSGALGPVHTIAFKRSTALFMSLVCHIRELYRSYGLFLIAKP
jgi:hypothetical protein